MIEDGKRKQVLTSAISHQIKIPIPNKNSKSHLADKFETVAILSALIVFPNPKGLLPFGCIEHLDHLFDMD